MIIFSALCILYLLVIFFVGQTGMVLDAFTYYFLHIGQELTYLAMLWYVISILQFAHEPISIQTPFSILLGLELVYFLISYTNLRGTLNLSMGVVMSIVFIYATINAFRVKNKELRNSFRVLGIAFSFTILLKFSLGFFVISPHGPLPSRYLSLFDEIPLLAILYLIIQTGKLLKEETQSVNEPS